MKSPHGSHGRVLLALGALLLLVSTAAYGQNVGTVRGTVRSADGEPLPGVLVQVTGDIVRGERNSVSGATPASTWLPGFLQAW